MIAAGVNAKALSTYMGHANFRITMDLYGHLMPGNEEEAAGLLDAYLQRAADQQARSAAPVGSSHMTTYWLDREGDVLYRKLTPRSRFEVLARDGWHPDVSVRAYARDRRGARRDDAGARALPRRADARSGAEAAIGDVTAPTPEDVRRLAADLGISEAEARRLIEVAKFSDKPRADGLDRDGLMIVTGVFEGAPARVLWRDGRLREVTPPALRPMIERFVADGIEVELGVIARAGRQRCATLLSLRPRSSLRSTARRSSSRLVLGPEYDLPDGAEG